MVNVARSSPPAFFAKAVKRFLLFRIVLVAFAHFSGETLDRSLELYGGFLEKSLKYAESLLAARFASRLRLKSFEKQGLLCALGEAAGYGGIDKMFELSGRRSFPCPVCAERREVRITKKKKPYITCDPCGIQVFIRGPAGIAAFQRLINRAEDDDLWTRLEEMERRYRLKCEKCGARFWAERGQVKTDLFDGSFRGFACPECGSVVEWRKKP